MTPEETLPPNSMSKTSIALHNLRGFVILIVIAFHSFLAYLAWQPSSPVPFDSPPYHWKAIPISDSERWFGFDLFCASQYVYLMQFMFFLSGLFVWPSFRRKGASSFVYDRALRLGVPFLFGVCVLMPLAHYPVYRVGASDPSWSAYWTHWVALPFWPTNLARAFTALGLRKGDVVAIQIPNHRPSQRAHQSRRLRRNPVDVEATIEKHPNVLQCAIVPMPDEVLGEKGCAFGCAPRWREREAWRNMRVAAGKRRGQGAVARTPGTDRHDARDANP